MSKLKDEWPGGLISDTKCSLSLRSGEERLVIRLKETGAEFCIDDIAENLFQLASFIRAMACRYNSEIDRLNSAAEKVPQLAVAKHALDEPLNPNGKPCPVNIGQLQGIDERTQKALRANPDFLDKSPHGIYKFFGSSRYVQAIKALLKSGYTPKQICETGFWLHARLPWRRRAVYSIPELIAADPLETSPVLTESDRVTWAIHAETTA